MRKTIYGTPELTRYEYTNQKPTTLYNGILNHKNKLQLRDK